MAIVNYLLNQLRSLGLYGEISGLFGTRGELNQTQMITMIVVVLVGLLLCFFGLKAIRVWAAVIGLVAGFLIGTTLTTTFFTWDRTTALIVGLVIGVLLAAMSAWLYRVGIFIYVFLMVGSLLMALLRPQNLIFYLICLVVAVLVAVGALKWVMPITIIVTAIGGGWIAGFYVSYLLPPIAGIIQIMVSIALMIVGALVQFVMASGKVKRSQQRKAAEISAEQAIANEVSRARSFLDEPEPEVDEEE